jgi:5-methylcytosine-specific restriction endonuclease McrA
MPYVNKPRPYKKEYSQQLDRGEGPSREKRREARAIYDKAGINRTGKDIDHKVPLSKGGGTKGNLKLTSPSANRSFSRKSNHSVKNNVPKAIRTR